jgi:hypothetical protein
MTVLPNAFYPTMLLLDKNNNKDEMAFFKISYVEDMALVLVLPIISKQFWCLLLLVPLLGGVKLVVVVVVVIPPPLPPKMRQCTLLFWTIFLMIVFRTIL